MFSLKKDVSPQRPMALLASFPRDKSLPPAKPTSSKKLKEASKGAFRKGANYHSFFNTRKAHKKCHHQSKSLCLIRRHSELSKGSSQDA